MMAVPKLETSSLVACLGKALAQQEAHGLGGRGDRQAGRARPPRGAGTVVGNGSAAE